MNRRDFNSILVKLGISSPVLLEASMGIASPVERDASGAGAPSKPAPPPLSRQYRAYICDHHSPDPPAMTYSKLNPEERVRLYEEAHLDHFHLMAKGHWGNAYYPTKVGHMQAGLKVDLLQAMSEPLRRAGMAFHVYYSVGFDGWAVGQHPDWAILDEEGKPLRIQPSVKNHQWAQWHWACLNTPYRKYVFAQLTEIVRGYDPDGFKLDIPGQPLCYCKYCRALYLKMYGHEIPRGEARDQQWREIQDFKYQTTQLSFVKEVIALVRSLGSKAAVTWNGAHLRFPHELMDLLDYTFAEPWAGNYLSSMFARGTGKLPEIAPGHVSSVYDPLPPSVFIAETAMIAAQNCRIYMYSETTHQDGTLDRLWFREMGEAYEEIEKIEPHLEDRDPEPCAAILYSERTQFYDHADGRHQTAMQGAMEAAVQSQFPSDILPDWKLTPEELKSYKMIVLPEATCLSDGHAKVLSDFVEQGGILLATGVTGTKDSDGYPRRNFGLADLMGCDFVRVNKRYLDNYWGSYLDRKESFVWEKLPGTNLVTMSPFVEVKLRDARVMATHILPAIAWGKDRWINWEPPPPGEPSTYPAIVETKRGKGRVLYASFDLFGMISKHFLWPADFYYQIARAYVTDPPLWVDSHHHRKSLGTTFYRKRGENAIVVHQVNRTVPELKGEVQPLPGGILRVRERYFAARHCTQIYPQVRKLKLDSRRGVTGIELPDVAIHNIVLIQGD